MAFQYQPILEDNIRLLELVQHSVNTLCFKLIHVSLRSVPEYTAISYTWRTTSDEDLGAIPRSPHVIIVNKCQFAVRANLHDALNQLLSSGLMPRHLWVDAICINQDDENDKNLQVHRMKEIYEKSKEVVVWLGKPENPVNIRLAFQMLADFESRQGAAINRVLPPWTWFGPVNVGTMAEAFAEFCRSLSPATDRAIFDKPGTTIHQAWLGLVETFSSRYWSRTWVYQESTPPEELPGDWAQNWMNLRLKPVKSKVRLLFGDQSTTWFRLYCGLAVANVIRTTPGLDSTFLEGIFNRTSTFQMLRLWRMGALPFELTFLDLLLYFRGSECENPRDKVYAPLCLASDTTRDFIRPDYSKTVSDVYRDVVIWSISSERAAGRSAIFKPNELDFLGLICLEEHPLPFENPNVSEHAIPSWIPQFSSHGGLCPIPKTFATEANLRRWALSAYRPLSSVTPTTRVQGDELFVSGVYIDMLQDVIDYRDRDPQAIRDEVGKKGAEWDVIMHQAYFTGEATEDVINRCFVFDLTYDVNERANGRHGKFAADPNQRPDKVVAPDEYMQPWRGPDLAAWQRARAMRGLSITEGCLLGVVPKTAERGDSLWALAGGCVLYVLRDADREKKQYTFIGECYVHGLMDGDIDRRLQEGQFRLQEISLV